MTSPGQCSNQRTFPEGDTARRPQVAVVIPAHNPGDFLREALESVLRQTLPNWELVVVDDASDEDLSWVESVDSRVTFVRQAHGGVSRARNLGVLLTTAPFVAFMDQDDVWGPRKLERQVRALAGDPAAGACFSEPVVFRATLPEPREDSGFDDPADVVLDPQLARRSPLLQSMEFFSSSFVVPSSTLLRRTSFAASGLLDPLIPFSGDYDALIKIGARHRVLRTRVSDVYYRKHDQNYSDRYNVSRAEVRALVHRYTDYARAARDDELKHSVKRLLVRPRALYASQAIDCARVSTRRRNWPAFARHLAWAFWLSPPVALRSVVRWASARTRSTREANSIRQGAHQGPESSQ